MSRVLCALVLALSVALLALGPTAAFANSSKPTYKNCDTCTTGKHGGSTNTCTPGSPGCNNVEKTNPHGNNCTCIETIDNKCSC
jgi:hypothetical protein